MTSHESHNTDIEWAKGEYWPLAWHTKPLPHGLYATVTATSGRWTGTLHANNIPISRSVFDTTEQARAWLARRIHEILESGAGDAFDQPTRPHEGNLS